MGGGFFQSLQKGFPTEVRLPNITVEPTGEEPPPPSSWLLLPARPVWQLCLAHTVPGSFTGLAPGPRLCNQHNQPTKPGWVGIHTKSKDPRPPNPLPRQHHRDEMRLLLQLFIQHSSHVLTKEGQILDQRQTQRKT